MKMEKIYLYTRFERLWHWLQAIMIFMLIITGFEVHGVFTLFGFQQAVELHNFFGISWIILIVFIGFWLLTTGVWKQYIPTTKKLIAVAKYYMAGIFKGEDHPVHKSEDAKHNPLQRLTYMGLAATLLPFQMATGFLYWTYNDWHEWGLSGFLDIGILAMIHMICAFVLISFVFVHIYMTTTGHSLTSHITAMFTGWEEVPEGTRVGKWETKKISEYRVVEEKAE